MKKFWYWPLLVCLLVSLFCVRLTFSYLDDPGYFGKADFAVFYTAASFALHHQPVYENPALITAVIATREAKGSVRYLYHPAVLALFMPLTTLPFSSAVWVWIICNGFLLVITLYKLPKLIPTAAQDSKKYWSLAVGSIVLFTPIFISLRTGQVNILLLCLLVVCLVLWSQKKLKVASLVLAAMIIIKLFPVILLIPLLIKRQWKFVIYTLVSLVVWLIITLPFTTFDNQIKFLDRAYNETVYGIHQDGLQRYDNPTINGLLYRLVAIQKSNNQSILTNTNLSLKTTTTQWIGPTHLIITLLVTSFMLWYSWKRRALPYTLMDASLWISYVLLVAKDAHIEYFVLLLPAFIAVIFRAITLHKLSAPGILAMVSFGLLCMSWMTPLPFVTLPTILLWLPTPLLGNILLMISIVLHEKSLA